MKQEEITTARFLKLTALGRQTKLPRKITKVSSMQLIDMQGSSVVDLNEGLALLYNPCCQANRAK